MPTNDMLAWDITIPLLQFVCFFPIVSLNRKVQKIQFSDEAKDLKMIDASVLTIYMYLCVAVINLICIIVFEILKKGTINTAVAT